MKFKTIKFCFSFSAIFIYFSIYSQEQLTEKFTEFKNHSEYCRQILVNHQENEIYFCGKNGTFAIKNKKTRELSPDYARAIFFNESEQLLYFSNSNVNTRKINLKEKLAQINVKTGSIKHINIPVELFTFLVEDNLVLSYGRKPFIYDVISLKNPVATSQEYYTYLDENDQLKSTASSTVERKVDLKFILLNNTFYAFEGMYVNDQKNKLKGIYTLNNGNLNAIKPAFPFLKDKIIRSLNFSKNEYIAATTDSLFIFNNSKILIKYKLPEKEFENANQIPNEVYKLNSNEFLVLSHLKNKYSSLIRKFYPLTNKVDDFIKEKDYDHAIHAVDVNNNIWMEQKENGIVCFINSNDNYLIEHQHKNNSIKNLTRYQGELLAISKTLKNFGSSKLKIGSENLIISFETSKQGRRYFIYKEKHDGVNSDINDLEKNQILLPKNEDIKLYGNYVQYITDSITLLDTYNKIFIINEVNGSYKSYLKPYGFETKKVWIFENELLISSTLGLMIFDVKTRQFLKPRFNNQDKIYFAVPYKDDHYLLIRKNKIELVEKINLKTIASANFQFIVNDVSINNNNIWLATQNNGIVIYNSMLEQIRNFENKILFSNSFKLKTNVSLNRNAIYVATNNGVLLLDEDVIIQRKITNEDFIITTNKNILTIKPNSISTPNFYKFKVRINDNKWQYYNGNSLDLNYLSHGTHQIEVKYNINNHWVQCFKQVIIVNQAWYKRASTLIFGTILLFSLIMLSSVLIANYQRIRRKNLEAILNQKFILEEKLNNIQNAIAMDIHDNFGNRIAGISSVSNILEELNLSKKLDSEKFDKFIKHLLVGVKQLDLDIKDLIWSNNSDNNNLNELVSRIDHFCISMFDSSKIRFDVNFTSDKSYNLPRLWNRQLLLIVKEIVNNAVKYANTETMTIMIKAKKNHFKLICIDEGIGFDFDSVQRKSGILNLKKRAELMDCIVKIESIKSKGTTITLEGKIP